MTSSRIWSSRLILPGSSEPSLFCNKSNTSKNPATFFASLRINTIKVHALLHKTNGQYLSSLEASQAITSTIFFFWFLLKTEVQCCVIHLAQSGKNPKFLGQMYNRFYSSAWSEYLDASEKPYGGAQAGSKPMHFQAFANGDKKLNLAALLSGSAAHSKPLHHYHPEWRAQRTSK